MLGPRPLQGRQRQPGSADCGSPAGGRGRPAAVDAAPTDAVTPRRRRVHAGAARGRRVHRPDRRHRRRQRRDPRGGAAADRRSRSRSTWTGSRCSSPPPSASPSARPATSARRTSCATPRWRCTAPRPTAAAPCELFDPAMRDAAVARLSIETDLRHAIEHSGFYVHYQPIISVETGEIAGFEALVRWRHPDARPAWARPSSFRIAEDTGMIVQIGTAERWWNRAGRWPHWQRQIRRRGARASSASTCRAASSRTSIWRARSRRCCEQTGLAASQPEARDHRERVHRRRPGGAGHAEAPAAASASGGASTISAPATRR